VINSHLLYQLSYRGTACGGAYNKAASVCKALLAGKNVEGDGATTRDDNFMNPNPKSATLAGGRQGRGSSRRPSAPLGPLEGLPFGVALPM
jgi:hypothetical protein